MTHKDLPTTVEILCCEYEGCIIGSAAKPDAQVSEVGDIDVIIPFHQWRKASKIVAAMPGAHLNKHGGTRFKEGQIQVDVWPDTIANNVPLTDYVWFPKPGYRLGKY